MNLIALKRWIKNRYQDGIFQRLKRMLLVLVKDIHAPRYHIELSTSFNVGQDAKPRYAVTRLDVMSIVPSLRSTPGDSGFVQRKPKPVSRNQGAQTHASSRMDLSDCTNKFGHLNDSQLSTPQILLYLIWIALCRSACSRVGASPMYLHVWSFFKMVSANRFQLVTMPGFTLSISR